MSMTAEREVRERLQDLPPSHKWVLTILSEAEAPLTSRQIADRTAPFDLPPRTVRDALFKCRQLGVVERHPSPTANGKPRYGVAGEVRQARED